MIRSAERVGIEDLDDHWMKYWTSQLLLSRPKFVGVNSLGKCNDRVVENVI